MEYPNRRSGKISKRRRSVTKFNFKKVMNPIETIFTANDKDGINPITFRLRPPDTSFAFDASRWMSLVRAGRVDDANELQFQLGVNRVSGWNDVFDEDDNAVEFNTQTFSAFTRLVDAIPYIMSVGEETLKELEAIPNLEHHSAQGEALAQRAEMICEARVIPGEPIQTEQQEETLEPSTSTP
jgi:hypothetical protein